MMWLLIKSTRWHFAPCLCRAVKSNAGSELTEEFGNAKAALVCSTPG